MTTLTRTNGFFTAAPGTKLLGEIITWSCSKISIRHIDLIQASRDGGLDESVARELAPRHAFAHACKKLAQQRIIRQVAEDETTIKFQFTAEHRDGDHFAYDLETMLSLTKDSGRVTGDLPGLATLAQEELDRCLEARTGSDVTRIIQKLFERRADLFPIREQGGCYFVPQEHVAFVDQVQAFLGRLNGKMNLSAIDKSILKALDDAVQTAAKEGVRFAVQKLQLRGGKGEIVATDGKQLLLQGNFALPWKEDVLIPAVSIFGCRELPQDASVAIGKTDKHVCIRVGHWTFFLSIDADSRFPNVEGVIPRATGTVTTCHLSAEDAAFLLKVLPRLPGREVENAPLTLDLNGEVIVRAKGEDSDRITEVVLANSTVTGPTVRVVGNRHLFARAVQLGFTEFRVSKPDVPLGSSDKFRTFVWMPLGKDGALASSEDALRISSAGDEPASKPHKKERSKETMTRPNTNGQNNDHAPSRNNDDGQATTGSGLGALIAEAQALKEVLHDAYGRTSRLLVALKRQRKQSRLMQTTLASLKQLQQIEG